MIKSLIKKIIKLSPETSLFLRTLRDQLDRNDQPIKTQYGFTLAGNRFMAMGDFEPSETQIVRHLLKEVDVLVNIGANVGYYCLHALSLGKPVIAAEPISRNLHYLLKNIRDNGWAKQAEIFPVALGQSIDILEIFGGGQGPP
ncbi:class I SAM-dependent methyltransferase [Cylindrospermopsis curvispora]|uniref:FkbM family methyltransferase n=1 Tax=Cylindrospermopsis curvispora GIHE-G1 TaxID=2666332 RepID=A0A7H0F1K2_9CYAN|nr:hypothetical protein [Cylindrospermopsis curvispora]QNP29918.1 hypothetical protein IAR63_02115 [Cylindrospermopsis curvispora GIHE-G1]